MKKICIINHGLASGGTDAFVVNILKNIDRTKFTVDLFLAVNPDSEPQFREEEAMSFLSELSGNIYKIGDLGTSSEKVNYIRNLYNCFKNYGPYDVVHSNMDLFNGINLTVAKLAGIKRRISHSHTAKSQFENQTGKHIITKCYQTTMRFLINVFSTAKLGCSQTALNYLYGKNQKNAHVIYNGINLDRFYPQKKEKTGHITNIITVGNLIDVKNPFFTIEIIDNLSKIRNDFNFIWVGTGALEEEVKTDIYNRNLCKYFTMLGRRSDIDLILKECSLFLMPSQFEGLGIAIIEAQATDLSCIVSTMVPREVDCGKCEFLPLEKGAEYWAKVINEYLDGKRKNQLNLQLLERFDEQKTIKQIEQIYSK